jgi:MGT family glycosyltransferase
VASILVYTSPARGHLFPALGVSLELRRRGHNVFVSTLAAEVEKVRSLGLHAEPIDPSIEARELDDWKGGNSMQALKLSMSVFGDRALFEVDDLQTAIEKTSPDALLIDTNSWGAQAAAEASDLPWATFQPYFTPLPAPGVPPFGPGFAPAGGKLGRLRDKALRPLIYGKLSTLALPGINAQRVRVGLAPLASMDDFLTRPPLVIYFTAKELDYPRSSWPDNFRLVWPADWGPEAEEPEWLGNVNRPIVLVTCSTERQEDGAILDAALQDLPRSGYFVVATSAAIPPEDVTAEPSPHARIERFVPHDAILPRVEAVVCHGGMGTTQRALSHGVPVVVVPFGRDQLEVARRVEHAGVGVRLLPKKLGSSNLVAAVRAAQNLSEAAHRMSNAFANAGGSEAAAESFESLLDEKSRARARPTG